MEKTVIEQGITPQSKLILKVQYFKIPVQLSDPVAIHLFYLQIQQKVVSAEYLCSGFLPPKTSELIRIQRV